MKSMRPGLELWIVHWQVDDWEDFCEMEEGGDSEEEEEVCGSSTITLLLESRQNVGPPGIDDGPCGSNKTSLP